MALSEILNDYTKKLSKVIGDAFAAILILLLLIFVVGELWAVYFSKSGNAFMLWLPVVLLMVVLVVKALD
ncbi:MAG: hypothetical protein JXB14_06245 [Candidatus Altiarchaeota archaeon]|nr:hypothetical protein [Candidatus Altiarchaeota archaeon]